MILIACLLMLVLVVLLGQRGSFAHRCRRVARRAKDLGVEELLEMHHNH